MTADKIRNQDGGHRPPLQQELQRAQSHGTNDCGLLHLLFLFDLAQTAIFAQGDNQLREPMVGDAGAQLTIERICGRGAKRKTINFFNRLDELLRVKECSLHRLRMSLKALIGAKTSPGWATQLSTHRLFFPRNMLNSLLD